MAAPEDPEDFDIYDPANVSPFVVWLCTDEAQEINGQAFIVGGSGIWWMRNWSHQNSVKLDAERWTLDTIDIHRFLLFGEMETGLPKFEAPPFS